MCERENVDEIRANGSYAYRCYYTFRSVVSAS